MRYLLTGALSALTLLVSAGAAAADNPLGTPAAQAGRFSDNHAEAVRAAMPPIDAAGLARVMEGVARAAAQERPLAIGSERDFENVFGVRSTGRRSPDGYVEAGVARYKIDLAAGRAWISWQRDIKPVARATPLQLRELRAAHAKLAAKLGLASDEIMFTDFREVLSQTDTNPRLVRLARRGTVMSEGASSLMLRAVGGVQVEGSTLRISSVTPTQHALVDLRWPMVHLPDEALRSLREPRELLEPLIKRVSEHNKGQPVNVMMAVVLRPDPDKPGMYVPALKVGVQPKPVRTEGGMRTDAGEIFYCDLIAGRPPFADQDQNDNLQSTTD